MYFAHTIRGRLLLWIAGLFGLVLAGFGLTAFQLYRLSAQQRIDEELERRVTLLQADWRASVPPGGGLGGRGGKTGRRSPRPEDREGPPPPFEPHGPPPPFDDPGPPPPFADPGLPPPERDRRGRGGDDRRLENAQLRLAPETARLFPDDPSGFYYAGWTGHGKMIGRSTNGPADIPMPEDDVPGRSYHRTRGVFRETYHFTAQGDCVLAGISTAGAIAARRQFAGWLFAAGGVVLLIGLGIGWIIIRRSFRPVEEISAAAKRIANGALSERVKVDDARNELGSLAAVLNSTFARLEAAISDEKTFTSDASHELRTPLTVMLTETQRALARERSSAEYRQTIEVCHETAQEMKRLTESLLELARLDAGEEVVAHAAIDLHAVAAAAVQAVRPLAEARQIKLAVFGGPAPARGDADRMKQVTVNLLQNAIRYNRDGGSIRVVTAAHETYAILTVSDTGIGIGPEDLPHIFKRFYRADKARSRTEGNSGLGLAICKSIIDSHQGSIEAESTPGAGSTFTVRIPRG
jgi:two-component system, OmpR family, sensor kinase